MKDLTIIYGQNEKFVLIGQDADNYGLKAYYVPFSAYNDGDFDENGIIEIEVEYQYQIAEKFNGWMAHDYDLPNYAESNAYPGDDDFDYAIAEESAQETANELILQHEIKEAANV